MLIVLIAPTAAQAAGTRQLELNPIIANDDEFTIVDVRMRVVERSISA